MTPRYVRHLGALCLVSGLMVGCTSSPPTSPTPKGSEGGAAPQATSAAIQVPQSIQPAQSSPAAPGAASPAPKTGSPVAAPAATTSAAPSGARVEPQGQVVYAWHTSLSPAWVDPDENQAVITPFGIQYALHDAMVKPLPGKPFEPSLAESYEIAPDFRSATFKLRPNLTFHDGSPITSEDVKFTYEKYKGVNARILHDKLDRIETPDDRTTRFLFKEPFLDFLNIYGTPASGAAWIIPKRYYEQVGGDGFKQQPIGAGPYKMVGSTSGNEFRFEAFTDYWRKTPSVKTLIIRGVAEDATRVAQLQTGEADLINLVPGALLGIVQSDPNLRLAPVRAGNFWMAFRDMDKPDNPFSNAKVREAVYLAIDRQAIADAEEGGQSLLTRNWIASDWPGALPDVKPEYDPARAKQFMAEAGYADGFDVEQLTPLPPYFSIGERVITQLREIGIRTKLNTMERGAFLSRLAEGPNALKGIILHGSAAPGDAASRIRAFATCNGSNTLMCVPEIDAKFAQYEQSTDPRERERLLTEIQQTILDNNYQISIYRQAFINAVGPRIANEWSEIFGAAPQYIYVGPYEDIRLKE
ncbi:MAG TPA: ABC transporter substrate-binding protein [Dehalococcoidia bacterium]|nr:ABC transporter substrate-binding protein [Dehalococcoidia bacterium]